VSWLPWWPAGERCDAGLATHDRGTGDGYEGWWTDDPDPVGTVVGELTAL